MKYIDADILKAEIERRRDSALERQKNLEKIGQETVLNEMIAFELNRLISFIDSLQQEYSSLPSDLDEAAEKYEKKHTYQRYDGGGLTPEYDATLAEAFIAGAQYAAPRWISVDEKLPEIDEEVIALTNQMHGKELDTARVICFAHRPNPNGWDGRSLSTGKVEHFDVETYDGWNIPGVKFWMPMPKIPNEEEI